MSETRLYKAPGFAHGLLMVVLMLLGGGLVAVYSATAYRALVPTTDGHFITSTHYMLIHIRHIAVATGTLLIASFMPLDFLERHCGKLFILFGIVFMLLVLAIGFAQGGSRRWLDVFGIKFQPGEFAKVTFCIWLAYNIGTKDDRLYSWKEGLLPNLVAASVLFLLFFLQPDLGSSLVLGFVLVALLFIGGARKRNVAAILGIVGLFAVFSILWSDERIRRVMAWLNPAAYRDAEGFQLHQAVTSVGSGQLFGRGLGQGPQNIAGYVPEAETDFIFANISEELGLIGSGLVIAAFAYILYSGISIAMRHTNPFRKYLALSLTFMIVIQAGVHICVATGVFPTKGLTLPFISLGGSSLIAMGGAMGLLLNLSRPTGPAVSIKEVIPEKGGHTVYVRERS